jgi:hypothetical protein
MFPSRAADIIWIYKRPMCRLDTSQEKMPRANKIFFPDFAPFLADAESINCYLQDGLPSMRAYVDDRVLQYTFPFPEDYSLRQQNVPFHLARMVVKVCILMCMSCKSASDISWRCTQFMCRWLYGLR